MKPLSWIRSTAIALAAMVSFAAIGQVNQWSSGLALSDPIVQQGLADAPEDINICGTGVGETPFTIDAQLLSNYNGFGVSCKDICDAQVEVSVTGGIGPFSFQWVGGPTTAIWNAACGGTEIVIVTDLGQGIQCAAQVQVSEPAAISVLFVGAGIQPPSCSNACDGSATYFAIGGASPYTYQWNSDPVGGNSVNDLCAGLNTLHIEDQNGCSLDTTFLLIVDTIQVTTNSSDLSCFGVCDGWISLDVSGGQPGYTYNWVPTPAFGQATDSIWGLCAGDYSVTITDVNNCDTVVNVTILEPLPINPNETSIDASCGNICDGEASVNPTSAIGPFTYDWTPDPPSGDFTNAASGLCSGIWQVLITDQATGCDTLVTITVGGPPELVPSVISTDATCNGICDGAAEASVAGGVPGYMYLWTPTPGTGQGTSTVGGLCQGTFTLTITDALNCDTTVTFTIDEPAAISPDLQTTDASCFGLCDGTATVSPIGGTPGYTYSWSPTPPIGAGTDSVSGLCPGSWAVMITDLNGCDTLISFDVDEPSELLATLDVTATSCIGDCDGSASVLVSGGTPNYSYLWNPTPATGQGTGQASGFCAGAYTLTVTDDNGCELVVPFVVDDPAPFQLNLLVADPTCGSNCDGTADITVAGGNGGYSYLWTPSPPAGQGTPNVSGLCLGSYSVLVADSLGCDTLLLFDIISPPLLLPGDSVTAISCSNTCDGEIFFSPTGGVGSVSYFWNPEPPNGQGVSSATGLCPGQYEITLTDATGCDTVVTVMLVAPLSSTVVSDQSDISCAGECTGSAWVDVLGSDPFSYLWTPGPPVGQGTDSVSGLCAGIWDLLITDVNGCDTVVSFNIQEPDSIAVLDAVQNTSCAGECDGWIDLSVSGGSGPYSYSWSPTPPTGAGTPSIADLCTGLWTVTITDSSNCVGIFSFTVSDPVPFDATFNVIDPSCGNSCDGSVSVTVVGGQGPYSYDWTPTPPTGQGTPVIGGICLGTYSVLVTDSAGCDTVFDISVTSPPVISVQDSVANATCSGTCDGSITLTPSGGLGPFTVVWDPIPPNGQGTLAATGLCQGQWEATISDSTGCDTVLTFNITAPPLFSVVPDITNPPCVGECTGEIQLQVTGGTGPFNFLWAPIPPVGQGTSDVSGLCPGQWTVVVTDVLGCDTTMVFDINQPDSIVATLTIGPSSCGGLCDGTASISASGGTGPLTYTWSPGPIIGQGTSSVSDLCPGSYSVTIADSLNCDTTLNFIISSPSGIVAVPAVQGATCANICDGEISLAMSGGLPPYNYNWSPAPTVGQGTANVTNLCPGQYTVVISDAALCDTVLVIDVDPAVLIDPAVISSDVSCNGSCDGAISLVPVGGVGTYSYLWSPLPPSGQGVSADSSLCAGTYTITISDGNGCDTTVIVNIDQPAAYSVQLNTTQSNCAVCDGAAGVLVSGGSAPLTTTWFDAGGTQISTSDSIFGQCAGIYQLIISDANNCDSIIDFLIEDATGELLTTSMSPASCSDTCDGEATVSFICSDPPCTIEWLDASATPIGQTANTALGLCADRYFAVVTNTSGCISVDTVDITAPGSFLISQITQQPNCAGDCNGSINVTATGGSGGFQYFWSPTPPVGQGSPIVQGLCAGTWTLTITDTQGCDSIIDYSITEPTPIQPGETVVGQTCANACDGTIFFNPAGGSPPYTYLWSPVPPGGQGQDSVSMLCAGTYTVTVIDASNCVETVTLAIPELDPYSISIGQTPADCGACNGSAQALVSGAGGSYNYTWTDTSGMQLSTSAIADSLCSGIYFLSITDQTGCDTSLTITISDADGELIIGGSQSPDCATSCNGLAFIQYTCSDPPCLIEWFDGLGNTLGVTNDTLSPVCAGSYVVSVTNASACVTLETVIVDPALGIQLTAAVTGISCNGLCDGSASVSISSGTGPFSYQWTPAPGFGQGTPAPSDMCAGTYDLLITDSLGCDTTISVTVPDVVPFNVFVTVDGNDCAGECSAAITLNPSGSNPPYFYNWSVIPPNGQGGNQAIGLCAGNYTVTIFDSNNCDTTITVTVSDPAPISTSVLTTPSSCGSCDGTLALTLTGGTGSVSVEWFDQMGIPVGSGSVLTNQCAGIYTAVITDSLGCDTSVTSAISDIDGELIVTASQPTSCSGTCNGSASISYVCSNPPCNVEWFDIGGTPIGQTSDTATGLCAGGYFVVLTNGLGCLTIDTVDIGAPAIGSIQFSTTPISCFGDCDGTATVSVTGGAGPFTYFWNPAPAIGQGTPTAGGLCVGSYTVTVSDANMCDTTLSILLIGPDELTATSLISNPTCAGQCDGSVFLVPSGGTPPYNYTWSPVPANGQGNNEGLGLCADTAFVDVEDANGCILNLAIPLTEPTPIIISLSVSDPIDCFGDCIGTADAVISGGIPPYQLTWLDSQGNTVGQDTLSLSALCAGSYTFLVIDSAGCASDTVFTIDQSDPFSVSLFSTNEGCISPCDAYAVVDVSGATGSSYNYSWSPSPPFGAGTDSIAGLCPGPWQVTITDSIGCDTTLFFTVGTAIPINVLSVQTDVSCFGSCDGTIALDVTGGGGSYDYQWTPAPPFGAGTDSISGLCPGSWQVLVSDSSGCDTTLLFMITEPDSISVQLDQVTSPTCASVNDGLISITVLGGSSPFVYQWSGPNGFGSAQEDISNLFPGTYTLMLLDDADCEFMYSITLDPVIEVIAIAGSDTVVCANGDQFYLDGSGSIGATTYAWTDLNGDPLGSDDSLLVSAGSAGTIGYVLTVSDGGQCFDVDTVLVTALQLPFVDAGPDQSVFGSDQILTLGGSPTTNTGNSVVWSPDTALSDPFAFNPQYPATQSGWFLVSVVDSSGCTALDSVFIEVLPEISVPSGFSPNGDGINDIWEIDIDLLFPDLVVEIYNRWGNLLYRSEGYTIPWDGNYEGDPVPVGTYYYVIDLKSDEYPEPLTGPLTILR